MPFPDSTFGIRRNAKANPLVCAACGERVAQAQGDPPMCLVCMWDDVCSEAAGEKAKRPVMQEFDGTISQFCALTRQLYPNCRICYDDEGQIVIHTGAMVEMGGEVCLWEPEDQDMYQSWCDRNPEVCG